MHANFFCLFSWCKYFGCPVLKTYLRKYQITIEDVMRAVHLKSFDYRVLNLLLYELRRDEVRSLTRFPMEIFIIRANFCNRGQSQYLLTNFYIYIFVDFTIVFLKLF